ncbi:peroxiredoxin [Neptunomonas concharum]|uniref:Glutathione-dependent peroxiredoxin n=1 Tax=Neptunomonas concharum TaxID=1031538 RepID=A0A5P1R945_9GAMM|nr:peroxiredoxin [Neptunomonas concharum]QEQ96118.1 peroxiredoxin [Neptunomonas concharum]
MIELGNTIPDAPLTVVTQGGQETLPAAELFAGKKVVLFAVPGAFTPTCSAHHLPGYVVLADDIKAKGVDLIACLSVNDAFVMRAWGEQQNADAITMLADGGGAFTKAIGLEMETGDFGGLRSQRYAMVIEDGVIKQLYIEAPKQFEVSKAEAVLAAL